MGYITYLQYDSRWGSKNYNGSSTMAQAGCGPTSVAMLAHAIKSSITPWTVAKYMQSHGYAIRNNGTAWAGIPAAMKNYGLKDVKNIATMAQVWKLLEKGYCAVFLMKAGFRGGITWTTSGHYIAVTNYKVKNGRHYVYTRDSGGRKHTGWYCYETQMQGLIPQVWCGYVPGKLKTTSSNAAKNAATSALAPATAKVATTTTLTRGQKLVTMAKKCCWKKGTPKSKRAYPSGKRRKAYTAALKKAYGSRSGWGKQTKAGASCDVFVGADIRAAGVDKKFPRGLDEQIPYLAKSSKWKDIDTRKRSKMKPGDVIVQKYKTGGKHIMIYMGDGDIANAHYVKKSYPVIEKYESVVKPSSKCKMFKVYRRK